MKSEKIFSGSVTGNLQFQCFQTEVCVDVSFVDCDFTVAGYQVHSSYGRFSSTFNGFADGTVDLGETYNLTEVRFYCYQGELYRAGTNFTLQVYYNGEWIDIVKNLTNEQSDAHTFSKYILVKPAFAPDPLTVITRFAVFDLLQ